MRSVTRFSLFGFGILMMVCAMAGSAYAQGPAPAPEIDGGSIAAGLAGVSAAVLIMRSRRRSK